MVFINETKFACQSCIKGHRSSGCSHTDRPLFEIRKKGRPVTQCDTCRDLRKTKRVHVKCCCDGRKDPQEQIGPVQIQSSTPTVSGETKRKSGGRKIPTVPTLPNGLKDVINKNSSEYPPISLDSSQRSINNLPKSHCDACPNPFSCTCSGTTPVKPASSPMLGVEFSRTKKTTSPSQILKFDTPISLVETHPSSSSENGTIFSTDNSSRSPVENNGPAPVLRSCCARKALASPTLTAISVEASRELQSTSYETSPVNLHGHMSCLCGASCLCLGCKLHNNGDNVSEDTTMCNMHCPEGCPSCVDNSHGLEAPPRSHLGVMEYESGATARFSLGGFTSNVSTNEYSTWYNMDAEGEYDDELDAEGSPDPDYCPLPLIDEQEHGKTVAESSKFTYQWKSPQIDNNTRQATYNARTRPYYQRAL